MATPNLERYEAVAQGLADGMSPMEAYIAAGYSAKGARTSVNTLFKRHPEILERRDEILMSRNERYQQLKKTPPPVPTYVALENLRITKETIIRELWDNAMRAKSAVPVLDKEGNPIGIFNANFQASNQALQLIGRELDMFLDKRAEDRGKVKKERAVIDTSSMSDGKLVELEEVLDHLESIITHNKEAQ